MMKMKATCVGEARIDVIQNISAFFSSRNQMHEPLGVTTTKLENQSKHRRRIAMIGIVCFYLFHIGSPVDSFELINEFHLHQTTKIRIIKNREKYKKIMYLYDSI